MSRQNRVCTSSSNQKLARVEGNINIPGILYVLSIAALTINTTKRMPRYYYCVRALISLASFPFGTARFLCTSYTHYGWLVVLAVFLTS